MVRGEPWTDEENMAIVDAYFSMVDLELAGKPYIKAEIRRALRAGPLVKRSPGSIEYKMQNISGVLDDYEQVWIDGYKPAFNYQAELEHSVVTALMARGTVLPTKRGRV